MRNSVTCTAPVNLAVIKYWGKRDPDLILPLNDSISVTLSQQYMHARTTVRAVPHTAAESSRAPLEVWLNGERQQESKRLIACVEHLRSSAIERQGALPSHRLVIESRNSFPTAAGLASSAAGFAALATAVARLYCLGDGDECGAPDSVAVQAARFGSGSACRSMIGGFVRWRRGQLQDGSDSLAEQIEPACHWPSLYCLILVVSDQRKTTCSSDGMRHTVATSSLMSTRLGVQSLTDPLLPAPDDAPVQQRAERMCRAIRERDFDTFARLCMRDSDEMHAVCAAAYPPVYYMNDTSREIVRLVHAYNASLARNAVCYTFDAGSNACCFMLEPDVAAFLAAVRKTFPPGSEEDWVRGESLPPRPRDEKCEQFLSGAATVKEAAIKYVICSRVGEAPVVVSEE